MDNGDLLWDQDVCKLLSITMEEYVAFWLCLPPHYSPSGDDEGDEKETSDTSKDKQAIKEIIHRWHLRLVFYMYDKEGSGSLLKSDLLNLVSDLVQLDDHVGDLVGQLCGGGSSSSASESTSFTIDDLSKKECSEVLDAHHCSLSTLLHPTPLTNTSTRFEGLPAATILCLRSMQVH